MPLSPEDIRREAEGREEAVDRTGERAMLTCRCNNSYDGASGLQHERALHSVDIELCVPRRVSQRTVNSSYQDVRRVTRNDQLAGPTDVVKRSNGQRFSSTRQSVGCRRRRAVNIGAGPSVGDGTREACVRVVGACGLGGPAVVVATSPSMDR